MSISIWYRHEDSKLEVVDRASNGEEAMRMVFEYRMAFAVWPGQHRYGKDKVWAGRRIDEPKE